MLVAGALLVQGHLTTVGTVAAFVLYLANLFNAITSLSALFDLLQSSGAALATVYKLLAVGSSMVDPERPALLPISGALELRSVDFAYAGEDGDDGDERLVLEGVDLRIEAGERLALVGPPVAASRPSPNWPVACTTPCRGRSISAGSTFARLSCPTSGNGLWCFLKRASCSGGPCWKTSPSAGPVRPLMRLGMRCASSG